MLKCRISLDTFAWELDESIVGQAKSFFLDAQTLDLENIGQGVWTLQVVDDSEQYEVELLLRSRVFQKVGCECEVFGQGEICGHIVAGFFALSEKLPKKALRNDSKTSIPLSKRKVGDFMEMIPPDRMDELVENFAKKNRRFALLLRAAATPYALEEPEKYKQLFYLVVKHATSQKRISVSGLNFINEVAVTIMNELKNLLMAGNTQEVQSYVDDYLRSWPIVMNYELPEKKKAHTSLILALQLLESAISIIMAPELIEAIAVMLASHVPIYTRLSAPVAQKLLAIIKKIAKDSSTQNRCTDHLVLLIEQDLPFYKLQDTLSVLVEWGTAPTKLITAISPIWREPELKAYCQLAINQGHFELLGELVSFSRKLPISTVFEQELADYELLIAKSSGDEGRLIFLAENNFKNTGQIKYYKILKDLLKDDWAKEARRLYLYFLEKQKPLLAALMLVDLKAWEELLGLVADQDDLFLLAKVDKFLLKHKPKEIKLLYLDLLAKYFDQHLGGKPVDMYVFLQEHLYAIGYSAFAKEIKAWMRQRYGHRPLLKEVF